MNAKLKVGFLWLVLLGFAALLILERREIKRLTAESAGLRSQLNQLEFLQETNRNLADVVKSAVETSEAHQGELLRLRDQVSRLHQVERENAQLKTERQQLEQQLAAGRTGGPPEQGPGTPALDPKGTSNNPALDTTDLGELELQDGIAARFELGGGTNCVVTPAALSDGNIAVRVVISTTNADGTTSFGQWRVDTRPDKQFAIEVGDRAIAMAVKLKP